VDNDEAAAAVARRKASQARHDDQVRRLMNEGLSKAEAESKAGY
jgi:hypothetical protein